MSQVKMDQLLTSSLVNGVAVQVLKTEAEIQALFVGKDISKLVKAYEEATVSGEMDAFEAELAALNAVNTGETQKSRVIGKRKLVPKGTDTVERERMVGLPVFASLAEDLKDVKARGRSMSTGKALLTNGSMIEVWFTEKQRSAFGKDLAEGKIVNVSLFTTRADKTAYELPTTSLTAGEIQALEEEFGKAAFDAAKDAVGVVRIYHTSDTVSYLFGGMAKGMALESAEKAFSVLTNLQTKEKERENTLAFLEKAGDRLAAIGAKVGTDVLAALLK